MSKFKLSIIAFIAAINLVIFFLPYQSFALTILINEINFNPNDIDDSDGEFIELLNAGQEDISMTGYTITGVTVDFTGITIPSGGYLVLAREPVDGPDTDKDSFESKYGNGDKNLNEFNFTIIDFSGSLNNGGETISIADSNNNIIDSYNYSPFTASAANGGGFTLERISTLNTSNESSFAVSAIPWGTPGSVNSNSSIVLLSEPSGTIILIFIIISIPLIKSRKEWWVL